MSTAEAAMNMTDQQRAAYYAEYARVRREEVVGVLLALFLGTFGAHHFYLRRTGLGILYLCFFWTGIISIISLVEAFFMPGRVRRFNEIQKAVLYSQVMLNPALAGRHCASCGSGSAAGVRFCARCGSALAG